MHSHVMFPTLMLASASPRRRQILETLKIPHVVRAVDVDETELQSETPEAYLTRVVDTKRQTAELLPDASSFAAVLVADTTVVLDGELLAKPLDRQDNIRMLRRLAGRLHHVMTRFAVSTPGQSRLAQTVVTEVRLKQLSEQSIEAYVNSGEGQDKAGGYAIQGLGSFAVENINGSYTNVVGLPAAEVVESLLKLGVLERFPG